MGLGLGGSPNQTPGFSAVICTGEWAVLGGGQRTHRLEAKPTIAGLTHIP